MKKILAAICASSLLAVPVAFGAGSGPLSGQTASGTFTVKTKVLATCTVTNTTLTFANYDPTSGTDDTGSSNITLTCTKNQHIQVSLDQGGQGPAGPRAMTSVANGATNPDKLGYELYQDSGYATVWGDGTTGTIVDTNSGGVGNAPTNIPIYGKITAGQDVAADDYQDVVNVTVNY